MKPFIAWRSAGAAPLVLVGWLAVTPTPAAEDGDIDEAATRAERMQALEDAIAKQRKVLQEVRGKRGDAVDELESLRERLDELRSEIEALERDLETASKPNQNGG